MERKVRDSLEKAARKGVFFVEEWDDRGNETYQFKKFRNIAMLCRK